MSFHCRRANFCRAIRGKFLGVKFTSGVYVYMKSTYTKIHGYIYIVVTLHRSMVCTNLRSVDNAVKCDKMSSGSCERIDNDPGENKQ